MTASNDIEEEERNAFEQNRSITLSMKEKIKTDRAFYEKQVAEKAQKGFLERLEVRYPLFKWELRPSSYFSSSTQSTISGNITVISKEPEYQKESSFTAYAKRTFSEGKEAEVEAHPDGRMSISAKGLSDEEEKSLAMELALGVLKNAEKGDTLVITGKTRLASNIVAAVAQLKKENPELYGDLNIKHNGALVVEATVIAKEAEGMVKKEIIEPPPPPAPDIVSATEKEVVPPLPKPYILETFKFFDREKLSADVNVSEEEREKIFAFEDKVRNKWMNDSVDCDSYESAHAKYQEWQSEADALAIFIKDNIALKREWAYVTVLSGGSDMLAMGNIKSLKKFYAGMEESQKDRRVLIENFIKEHPDIDPKELELEIKNPNGGDFLYGLGDECDVMLKNFSEFTERLQNAMEKQVKEQEVQRQADEKSLPQQDVGFSEKQADNKAVSNTAIVSAKLFQNIATALLDRAENLSKVFSDFADVLDSHSQSIVQLHFITVQGALREVKHKFPDDSKLLSLVEKAEAIAPVIRQHPLSAPMGSMDSSPISAQEERQVDALDKAKSTGASFLDLKNILNDKKTTLSSDEEEGKDNDNSRRRP